MNEKDSIATDFTQMFGCRYPVIGAPMFLVSNVDMVVAISEAGGLGVVPSLNYRPSEKFREALEEIRAKTQCPYGVNLIVNSSNKRWPQDLKHCLDVRVPLIVTSLGNPSKVIEESHKVGTRVFCDVTNLNHAKKVEELGADGVIAVGAGAGGHAGPITNSILVPWLKSQLKIPVVAAGGVASGRTMASMLALGASAVSVGTRFIASHEAQVNEAYKEAIVKASPEDIILTERISGTPASVIATDYIRKMGTQLPWVVRYLKGNKKLKKIVNAAVHYNGLQSLTKSAQKVTWKNVWSAGQTVGLITEVQSCQEIVRDMVVEYRTVVGELQSSLVEQD